MFYGINMEYTRKTINNMKKSTVDRIKHDASSFIYSMAGIRTYIMPGSFYRHITLPGIEMLKDIDNKSDSNEYMDFLELNVIYQYALMAYRKKHSGRENANILAGVFSGSIKLYKLLSGLLMQSIVNCFPLAVVATFDYYQNFSPGKKFESILIEHMEGTGMDGDKCARFFMEIINSAENSPKWKRRMVAVSHELYGEDYSYNKLFSIFELYILYRINNFNISETLRELYTKSPLEISKCIYNNREKIEGYLAMISLKG
jgi:hypothetical protein